MTPAETLRHEIEALLDSFGPAWVDRMMAAVAAMEAELLDARSYVAEVALGVTHYAGCAPEAPCCRCRLEERGGDLDDEAERCQMAEAKARRRERRISVASAHIEDAIGALTHDCDGDHCGPPCPDPGCWHRDEAFS